jgi:forkhead box protein K
MERSTGERGKGYYWSIDENFEHIILEQDIKLQNSQAAAGKEGRNKKTKGPLPPPLTSAPLAMKSTAGTSSMTTFRAHPPPPGSSGISAVKVEAQPMRSLPPPANPHPAPLAMPPPNGIPPPAPPVAPGIPPTVRIPIIVGPVPTSHVPSSSTELSSSSSAHLPTPPIVLHDNTLILNPTIFGHLTPENLKGLEGLGAQKALEILQGYIVRFLKERIRTEGGRGRGRGHGRGGRPGGPGRGKGKGDAPQPGAEDAKSESASSTSQLQSAPSVPQPLPPSADQDVDVEIEILDDDDEDGRASKKRRLNEPLPTAPASAMTI